MCLLCLSDRIQVKLRTPEFPNPTAIMKELELGKHEETRPGLGKFGNTLYALLKNEATFNPQVESWVLAIL